MEYFHYTVSGGLRHIQLLGRTAGREQPVSIYPFGKKHTVEWLEAVVDDITS